MPATSLNERDDMRTLVSRIATFLLAPVMLSVSCFSCLIQPVPAYAAASSPMEIVLDEPQGCDQITEEPATDSPALAPLPADASSFSDRNAHATHDVECSPASLRTSADSKPFERIVFHSAIIHDTSGIYKTTLLSYHPFLSSPPPPPPYNRLLTGTTIKKE